MSHLYAPEADDVRLRVPPRSTEPGVRRTAARTVRVSTPGDASEQHADRVAARVGVDTGIGGRAGGASSRPREVPVSAEVASLFVSPGAGAALDPRVAERLRPAVGVDLADVRVHAGQRPAAAAAQLGARAVTVGPHIYLAAGESAHDVPLLTHEAAHAALHAGAPGGPLTVHRGVGSALARGWDMYTRMTDAGAPFARELIRWRVLGLGSTFFKSRSDTGWNDFMVGRPEIQRALAPELERRVPGWAAAGATGNEWLGGYRAFSFDVTNVRLNELESMRLTLHGCHRIEVGGRYWVGQEDGVTKVRVYPTLAWVDRGDLHPGTGTQLSNDEVVDDSEFTAAGWDYDIRIQFDPGVSVWEVSGGTARHVRGWPPSTGAPAAGFRG